MVARRRSRLAHVSCGLLALCLALSSSAGDAITPISEKPVCRTELTILFCTVDGKELRLNAFLPLKAGAADHANRNAEPAPAAAPSPALVEIHGGWWCGGSPAHKVQSIAGWQTFTKRGIALFSISYRLGKDGAFPKNIRDCRNAIRFIRKNAQRFNIDPERIGCMGISAGGHLSLMVGMAPDNFDDGGPTEELQGVSAKVCCAFAIAAPTDFVRQWDDAPDDVIRDLSGEERVRRTDGRIPNDARPYLRLLFGGVTPDSQAHKALYRSMSPVSYIRKELPPLLICDGEKDTIVPGLHGKWLHEGMLAAEADSTYWMTPNGGHGYPGGKGFQQVLDDFLARTLKLEAK
jgi:acetyl esterase/lipase